MPDLQERPRLPLLQHLAALGDPIERARAAEQCLAGSRTEAREIIAIRNGAVREAFQQGVSKPEIERRTGINIATIKGMTSR